MSSTKASINPQHLSFELDTASGRWSCSPGMRALYGIAEGESPTTAFMADAMVTEDRDQMLARFWYHATHTGPFQYEFRIRDAGGRVRHLVLVGESHGTRDQVTRMSGYLVDISDTLNDRAEAAVLASAEHRAVIEQCKGMLMAGFGLSDEAAFALLRKASNEHNVRLSEVSRRIVGMLNQPSFSEDTTKALRQVLLDWA